MKHAELYSGLIHALQGEPLSSGFLTDGSVISASSVPYCWKEYKQKTKLMVKDQCLKVMKKWPRVPAFCSWQHMACICDIMNEAGMRSKNVK